jgi:hypothetical protein
MPEAASFYCREGHLQEFRRQAGSGGSKNGLKLLELLDSLYLTYLKTEQLGDTDIDRKAIFGLSSKRVNMLI